MDRFELEERTRRFALRVMALTTPLLRAPGTVMLARQLFRSGTAIGAIYREAAFAGSRKDFAYKMSLCVKEANETVYWLGLLIDGLPPRQCHGGKKSDPQEPSRLLAAELRDEAGQLLKILAAGLKTARKPLKI